MLLPKKGYLAPPVIIVLALITLAVAATLVLQAKFFSTGKTPSQTPLAQASFQSSPKPSTTNVDKYLSKEDCETKTGKPCNCMFTRADSEQSNPDCVGWGPVQTLIVEQMANWKTYTNQQLGILFKYPNNWTVDKNTTTNLPILRNENKNILIRVNYITAKTYKVIGAPPPCYEKDNCKIETVTTTAGRFTIVWRDKSNANAEIKKSNGDGVILNLEIVTSETKVIFNQILSTFQFL